MAATAEENPSMEIGCQGKSYRNDERSPAGECIGLSQSDRGRGVHLLLDHRAPVSQARARHHGRQIGGVQG